MKQLLPFKVGYESYAVELTEAQEVVESVRIDPFPGAPDVVAGAIAFHGRIVPVIDMPIFLGFPMGKVGRRLIVLVNARGPVALGVDQVGSAISLELSDYKPVQNYSDRKYIREVVNCNGAMIGMLNLDQLQTDLQRFCLGMGV